MLLGSGISFYVQGKEVVITGVFFKQFFQGIDIYWREEAWYIITWYETESQRLWIAYGNIFSPDALFTIGDKMSNGEEFIYVCHRDS